MKCICDLYISVRLLQKFIVPQAVYNMGEINTASQFVNGKFVQDENRLCTINNINCQGELTACVHVAVC